MTSGPAGAGSLEVNVLTEASQRLDVAGVALVALTALPAVLLGLARHLGQRGREAVEVVGMATDITVGEQVLVLAALTQAAVEQRLGGHRGSGHGVRPRLVRHHRSFHTIGRFQSPIRRIKFH